MMANYLPLKKNSKIWRQSSSNQSRGMQRRTVYQDKISGHERIPSSLVECLDQPSRREAWRFWLIILLLLPTVYYIKDLLAFEKSRFLSRASKHNDLVMPANKKMIFTTSTTEMTTTTNIKEATIRNQPGILPICAVDKPHLGTFSVRRPGRNVFVENQYPMILKGGYYSPVGCHSRHRIGVLVPYRDREANLAMFLFNIHPFLMKQKLEYRIFVVEQKGADKFNKGRLFNAGFEEMKKYGLWHCIVFHDVDLIPLDERILYSCPSWPRHMCATVVEKLNDPSYHSLFGGVTSMTQAHYEKVNGYSNLYWGWGGEDEDMFWRLRFAGFPVTRYNKTIARYTSLPHPMSPRNRLRYNFLRGGLGRYKQEGLSTLEYKLVSVTERHLYTHIIVDINPARAINSNPIKLLRKLQD